MNAIVGKVGAVAARLAGRTTRGAARLGARAIAGSAQGVLSFSPRAFIRALFATRLDKTPRRTMLVAAAFSLVFMVIAGRLVMFGLKPLAEDKIRSAASDQVAAARPDILDRNGEVLATDVKVMSIFAEPRRLIDKDEAVELLTAALPDVNAAELRKKLGSRKGFVWVKRAVTPKEQQEVFHLGLPGVGFLPENKRVYPNGPIAAHVLGFANLDGVGISGLEKYIDTQGLSDLTSMGFKVAADDLKPVMTSLDLRATYAVRDELEKGIAKFKAKNGAAAILDVNTGEVIAMASLPDFDPNQPADALDPNRINRLSVGVYEMGSTFKALTIAMGLETNKITLRSTVDARNSLQYGRFTIHDFHAEHKIMTVPEVFYHSSNIGAAKIAMMVGIEGHQQFLRQMGQLTRLRTELPESAEPLIPRHWGMLNTITIAFGQGINVAPLQSLMAVGALANGGLLVKPTFLKRSVEDAQKDAPRVIRPEVSEAIRYVMRLNAEVGSARNANIPGYFIGGKTGTADKLVHGHYDHDKVFTTFMAVLPADKPKYLFLTLMDEPQAIPGTYGYHTAAWNSGDVTGKIIERVAPLLGLPPMLNLPQLPFPLLARMGYGFANMPAHTSEGIH
ncbi:Cell division protein FtsI (Penicillin-binding protein 3) [Beijerinckiaceae bacterium RH AL1]|nr:Cell division protein FtsI (Penicillin-binding protein 3) [Beijerinckiaceae bacterium RH AL8]VVB43735.1 Cell division protein FtsI (Penicillin-binding protein 3) [Beijerinckiaceae bacterium RH CH11]VVC53977.1 Cell division protein FtsI (Penicillin-binding protein 3) [Beijerinckiaceae bacterium RH AL1]